jgi:hypothetical protein
MARKLNLKLAAALFLQMALALAAFAQVDRATLEGTVIDPSGAPVPGALVKISAVETGLTQERTTNANGYYRFPGIALGDYTVFVSYKGFKTKVIEEVRVQVGQTRTLDVALEIGNTSEKIEVQVQLTPEERSSAESSVVIGKDQIENLPLNGRNWANLTRLAPWAQDDGGGDQRTIRFAGRGRDDNNFSFDGVDATGIQEQAQKAEVRLQVSPDAIAEYRVSSALYDAEYGSQAGGQIDIVTKSGTNDYHGSVYGYFRNSEFDARNFNDAINGNPALPPFRMGQYGMTFGGPIVKQKAFFFMNYEGLRQYQQVTAVAPVPDPTVQVAALSGPQGTNLCPIIQAYPWRQSAVSSLQAFGCAPKFVYPDTAFAYSCPDPTNCLGTGFDNFTHQNKSIIHEDTWLARFDYKFSESTTFYARAQRDVAFARSPNGLLFDQNGTNNHPANYLVALQHLFGPNLLNEFKFGVNRAPFHNPVLPGYLDISLSTPNYESLNNSQTDNEVGTVYSYIDNLTWTHGRHTIKAGIEVKRVQLNQGKTESLSITLKGGASDNTSLINNQVDSVDFTTSWDGHALRRTFVMPYVQDEWKVTPNLTVNAGLRWNYFAPITEAHDRVKIFDLTACHGFCPPTSALEFPNYKNFDPRFSVAWAPESFHGKTVVRAGFGIYHGAAQNDDRNAALESDRTETKFVVGQGTPPLDQGVVFFQPSYLQKPPNFNIPASFGQGQAIARALVRHHPDLYVETWGLSIQQALPQNFLFTVSYLGSHGVHIFTRNYENLCDPTQLHPAVGQPIGPCVRPLDTHPILNPDGTQCCTFGTIDFKTNAGNSSYNGLLLALDRQFKNGLSFTAKYTLAHSINVGTIGGGEANAPQNADCLACEKGPSIYDVRHNIVLASVYQLPFGAGKAHFSEGLGAQIFGNWTTSLLWNWHTGHPLTVTMDVSGNPNFLPDGNDGTASNQRPDLVPGVSVVPSNQNSNNWINAAAFVAPPYDPQTGALLRYGNAGNGLIRSPNVWQVDFSVEKGIRIKERYTFQLGAQIFNILNHTQLADPNTSFTYSCNPDPSKFPPPYTCSISQNSNFGIITSFVNRNNNSDKFFADNTGSGLPRQVQFYFRFQF